jgi:nucleoside-diphosphate-sugar epimerase
VRILVTGASGLIGSEVVRRLSDEGHGVLGLSHRSPLDDLPLLGGLNLDLGAEGAADAIARFAGHCDAFVHAAASLEMDRLSTEIVRVNCAGTQQALAAARSSEAEQFVFISSIGVIGRPPAEPITEEHPPAPRTAYHATKLFGEHLVRLATDDGQLGTTLRVTAPVGARMDPRRILSAFVRRAATGEGLEVMGAGTRRQNYVDVRDVASAVDRALQQRAGGTFNVAGRESVSNAELAERCVRVLQSKSAIVNRGEDPLDGEEWLVSTERSRRVLDWEAEHSLENSIVSIAEAAAI